MDLIVDPHPLLEPAAFVTDWQSALGEVSTFSDLEARLHDTAPPVSADDAVRTTVRDLLRVGGFKPTGRSKPASEYLLKARTNDRLGPINAAVDACNVVSLHSGLPISVVDLDRTTAPLRLAIAPPDSRYVFNASGQEIDIAGLVCLFDGSGPCGGPVKDSQRTKTHENTRHTFSVIWGTTGLPGRTQATLDWYMDLVTALGGRVILNRPAGPAGPLA